MDETLLGDMHTLPHFARDRHFPIILSLIKHTSKGQKTQSGSRVISWIRWEMWTSRGRGLAFLKMEWFSRTCTTPSASPSVCISNSFSEALIKDFLPIWGKNSRSHCVYFWQQHFSVHNTVLDVQTGMTAASWSNAACDTSVTPRLRLAVSVWLAWASERHTTAAELIKTTTFSKMPHYRYGTT